MTAITFSGLRARTPSGESWSAEATYNADGYVFAVLTATEHAHHDALDLSQWSFWVLPRQVVAATGQQSISLARLRALADPPVPYEELASRIREVVIPVG